MWFGIVRIRMVYMAFFFADRIKTNCLGHARFMRAAWVFHGESCHPKPVENIS